MRKILDLFCGAGGAAMGLHRAGLEVTGVDITPQPNYPFEFIEADALSVSLNGFDAYWASPPCQAYTWATKAHRNRGKEYPELIEKTRARLKETGKPYIIENVVGAPLRRDLILCGLMFNLGVLRHRIFEIEGFHVQQPFHPRHKPAITIKTRTGRYARRSQYCTVTRSGSDSRSYKFEDWQKAIGIDWMSKKELTQAVPPRYSEYIASWLVNGGGFKGLHPTTKVGILPRRIL